MRIILVGASGVIGSAVARLLEAEHEIVRVGRTKGELRVDMSDPASIEKLFRDAGSFDALISAAGPAKYGPMSELTDSDYLFTFANKLLGQINLVRRGLAHIADQGSFTLTSGMYSRFPGVGTTAIAAANAGVEAFVRAAGLEMVRGVRVNCVSPSYVKETMELRGLDSSTGIPAERTAKAYVAALQGGMNGQVLDVRDHLA